MASVPLSQRLRDDITTNFKKQLQNVYRTKFNIQPAIDIVINKLENHTPELVETIQLDKQYQLLLTKIQKFYDVDPGHYHTNVTKGLIKPQTKLALVCNPNRPDTDHFTWSDKWAVPHTDEHSNDQNGRNYVEGDVGVSIENVLYYFPVAFSLRYNRGWREEGEYAPHACEHILYITDPDLCAAFSPIGEIENRIGKETEDFKNALQLKNTVKQFLDDWSAGKDLIPLEDLERMNKVTTKTVVPKGIMQSIPDDLKDSMNEVILTNKLLGDD